MYRLCFFVGRLGTALYGRRFKGIARDFDCGGGCEHSLLLAHVAMELARLLGNFQAGVYENRFRRADIVGRNVLTKMHYITSKSLSFTLVRVDYLTQTCVVSVCCST